MIYSLDTNTCIQYLNGRSPSVLHRLQSVQPQDVVICSVVRAELFYGAGKSINPAQTLARQQQFLAPFPSLPFDDQCAPVYGNLRARLATAGTPIGPLDLLIAAITLSHNLILVTHNTREFARIPGLRIEDWEV